MSTKEAGSETRADSRADKRDSAEMATSGGQIEKALSEFVVPLVEADGGEIYLVEVTAEDVHLHLSGTCAGCPGATMTRERLLEPTLRGVAPKATLKLTTGWRVPEGAKKLAPR